MTPLETARWVRTQQHLSESPVVQVMARALLAIHEAREEVRRQPRTDVRSAANDGYLLGGAIDAALEGK